MMDVGAESVAALVERLRQEIERARFAGDDPAVVVAPDDDPALIVAKTLAAERLNAPLRVGGAAVPLQEALAEAAFYRGVTALRYWRFPGAQAAFEEAGAKTSQPVLQQRLALYRAMAALVRRAVLADPDEPARAIPEERALPLVDTLDALTPAERAHYADEIRRLSALRRTLPDDPYWQAVHGLLRARLALTAGDDTLGLGWLLRTARLAPAEPAPSPYLADLLARARARLRRFLGDAPPPEEAAAAAAEPPPSGESPAAPPADPEAAPADTPPPETSADVRAGELLAALASHLNAALGRDLQADAARFGVTPYHEP